MLLPLGDGKFYGLGFSYTMKKDEIIDFAVAYMKTEAHIAAGGSDNSNSISPYRFIYNPYAGTSYDTEINAILLEASFRKPF